MDSSLEEVLDRTYEAIEHEKDDEALEASNEDASEEVVLKPVLPERNQSMIYVSNQLLDSIIKMTLSEKRVMWYVLRRYKLSDYKTIPLDFTIKHSKYAEIFNLSKQQAVNEIRKACDTIVDNNYYVPRPEWDGNVLSELDNDIYTKDELKTLKAFTKGNIAERCDFGIRRGESQVIFTRSFLEHAIPIKKYFTQYRLYEADCLNNANHIALFEELQRYFCQKTNTGLYETNPTRLINKLLLPKTYSKFTQMRRGFLIPAIAAINEKTPLTVSMKEIREEESNPKSKVKRLVFTYRKKS